MRNTIPLRQIVNQRQLAVLNNLARRGEESHHFREVLATLVNETIPSVPRTYETDGQGDAAIARLHYFIGSCDWYITELDCEQEQHQAFGAANLGYGTELGYISLPEILNAGAELDLHWTAKPLRECAKEGA
jgi:hypothetical protein